jgi:hypothetical protein
MSMRSTARRLRISRPAPTRSTTARRRLRDDQAAADAIAAEPAGIRSRRILERFIEVDARYRKRRKNTGKQSTDRGRSGREQDDSCVERDVRIRWKRLRVERQQRLRSPCRDDDCSRCAQHRQQNCFRHELPSQPPSAGAKRGANSKFAPPRHAASHDDVRQIRARDEQHEACRTREENHRRTQIANHCAANVDRHNRVTGVRLWVLRLQPSRDGGQIRVRGGERHARLESADAGHEMHFPSAIHVREDPTEVERYPDLFPVSKRKAWRHDADDRVCLVLQRDGAPHHTGIRTELTTPETVRQHDDVLSIRRILARKKRSPERGMHAENVEHVGRHLNDVDVCRRPIARLECISSGCDVSHRRHRCLCGAIVDGVCRGHLRAEPWTGAPPLVDHYQSPRIGVRERLEQHCVGDRERSLRSRRCR